MEFVFYFLCCEAALIGSYQSVNHFCIIDAAVLSIIADGIPLENTPRATIYISQIVVNYLLYEKILANLRVHKYLPNSLNYNFYVPLC